jgi:hypothetical protein
MQTTAQMLWGIVFGAIGFAYFSYGRKQKSIVPLVTGIALFIWPYLATNVYLLVIGGLLLMALPKFVRL